jgi:uncharacterized protein involved in outer membrane biogenesis
LPLLSSSAIRRKSWLLSTRRLNEKINGDINIRDIHITVLHHFPNVSIVLEDIYVHGPEYKKYHRPFFRAEWVDVNVELLRLLHKEISIKSIYVEKGEFFVFRTFDGYTNLRVFKKMRVPSPSGLEKLQLPDLAELNFEDVKVTYVDSLRKKTFGVNFIRTKNSISTKDSSTVIHMGGRMIFDRLMLNAAKGSFLKNKNVMADFNLELDPSQQHLLVKPSVMQFDTSTVRLSGQFALAEPGHFELEISSDQMDYSEGLTILNDSLVKTLQRYEIEKPLRIAVRMKGALQAGVKPAVALTFSFANSRVTAPRINMEQMTMQGSFMNHLNPSLPNDAQNSQLHFLSMKGLANNLPVEAEATLTDLRDPALELKAVFNVDLKNINAHLDITKLKMIEGKFVSSFTYSGKLQEYLDESRASTKGNCAAEPRSPEAKWITLPAMSRLTSSTPLSTLRRTNST